MAEGADEISPVKKLCNPYPSLDPVTGGDSMLDSLGNNAGSYRVSDGKLDVTSDSDTFKLVLQVPCQVSETDSKQLREKRASKLQPLVRIMILVVRAPLVLLHLDNSRSNLGEEESFLLPVRVKPPKMGEKV